MKHPPTVQGLHQAVEIPTDAWEAFFQQCREYAALARQRRAAKSKMTTTNSTDTNIPQQEQCA